MSKLIELDAAIEALKRAEALSRAFGYHAVIDAVEALPTVDAVPVVRCADCIRFRPDDDVWGWCTVSGKMRCKDYCSYGVRKDGGDEQTKKPE